MDVVRDQRDALHVEVLSAHSNADLLIAQALEFKPNVVVTGNDAKWKQVNDALFDEGIKVASGAEALEQVVEVDGIDMVLTAGRRSRPEAPQAPSTRANTSPSPTKKPSWWPATW